LRLSCAASLAKVRRRLIEDFDKGRCPGAGFNPDTLFGGAAYASLRGSLRRSSNCERFLAGIA
jgi:hypothetical protein